jgi:uncharacterized protein with NRDE domain
MCLAVLHYSLTEPHRLLLVANRDEAHARRTAPLHWWYDETRILGGRDLEAGGTWFAVDRLGRFGVLTNLRGYPVPTTPPSRGDLIPSFLKGSLPAPDFLRALQAKSRRYAGFNLLLGDDSGLWVYANQGGQVVSQLAPGYHGLGNGPWEAPWAKVTAGIKALQQHRNRGEADESLHQILLDRTYGTDESLPMTGLPLALERRLSAAFILQPDYGTRSTTVCRIDPGNRGWVKEFRYDSQGNVEGETSQFFGS